MEIEDGSVIVNSSRLKSVVWNDFDRVRKGDTFIAICRHCNRKLSGSSTSGTSHLRNHLIRCRRRSNQDISPLITTRGKRKETTLAISNFTFDHRNDESVSIVKTNKLDNHGKEGGNIATFNFDNRQSRLDLARMIILHGYPLAMVEHTGFRVFARNLQPFFDIPTFDGVEADCREIYLKERQKVYEELDKLPGISLTADTWTANGDAEYLCLTAHYIDDSWQLKKKILNFLMIDHSLTVDTISEIIMISLRNWDIDRKLFSVTFDTYSLYDKIIGRIREQLCQHRFLLCDGKLFDIRCVADLVKMMVKDALEKSFEIVHKVQESIRYVQQSQSTQEKFYKMAQVAGISRQKVLCLDNKNQWSSTYIMLETALDYKDAFTLLQEHDFRYRVCPSTEEWDRASSITGFLKHLFDISCAFSGSKYSTANMYFPDICELHLKLIGWCQNSDDFVRSLALKMKNRFDEYWNKCSLALAIAAILDPRFKMNVLDFFYPQIYGDESATCIDIVSNCLKALYHGHAIYSPLASHGPSGDSREDRLTGYDQFLCETSESEDIKSDLDKYLTEPLFPRNVDFDILNWWKVHTPMYPILSMMACNVLGIPLSKGALESIYDTGNREVDSSRGSLRPDTLQALMCAQDWMRHELEVTPFTDCKDSSGTATLAEHYDPN
ncbi:unnamed protein product [Cuscuta europaea]|uniref:BED-type domain-containing protein n=1 Tax=Cuscuta europaea TaxID=41803 RepID=A0A9P1EMC4_CUSEU|nr:unnamed protein product [Cuscuta europaea]